MIYSSWPLEPRLHAPDVKISNDIRDKPGTFTYHNPGVAYDMNYDLTSLRTP